jgi:hypothetical protein
MRTTNRTRHLVATVGLGAALLLGAVGAGLAAEFRGPPLICHSITIGENKSLPWEGGAMSTKKGYDPKHLVKDVSALLGTTPDVVVRMETLRRAAIYAREDGNVAWELLGGLALRALDADAGSTEGALALFDTGFTIAVLQQLDSSMVGRAGVRSDVPGYAYVARALDGARKANSPQVAAMEYGAALMTLPEMRHGATRANDGAGTGDDIYDAHIRAAAAGAQPGSLLETNLAAHLSNWGGSLEKARAAAKTHEARNVSARK